MTQDIVRAAIHPGVGIARIGNSEKYFLAPQVITPEPMEAGSFHASDGTLKREAVQFRIYGYNAAGDVVEELTPDQAGIDIEWGVHMVARKAAWYKFRAAMDLPAAADFALQRRNPDYAPDRRDDLVIDPGARTISGKDAGGTEAEKLTGVFRYKEYTAETTIGELRTDEAGRLVVMSGFGESGSPAGLPVFDDSGTVEDPFGNAAGWYDGGCDGPVTATVRIGGRDIPCEGAWVAVAPPNFAPEIIGWRTLLDLLEEVWADAGWTPASEQVSFTRDIYPLLGRLSGLQWVNRGFVAFFGPGGPLDFTDPALIDKISCIHGQSDIHKELRRQIFNAFRPVTGDGVSLRTQPWIYGDAFGTFPDDDPDNGLPLWPAAARKMRRWVNGDFVADWGKVPSEPTDIAQVAVADQPAMLDRAPLHYCLADAFHPGCELTWPMRHASIWKRPFRIRVRRPDNPEPDYGDRLTTARALGPDGPLHAQAPGGLTRWMALPWQADTAGCRSGYDLSFDPNLPTFWPARVPNHVLPVENYDRVMDAKLSDEERIEAFYGRRSWYYPLAKYGTGGIKLMENMVVHFAEMGVVERREGPGDLPGIPTVLFVETLPHLPVMKAVEGAALLGAEPDAAPTPEDEAARRAGWQSEEERQFFRSARMARTLATRNGNGTD